MRAILAQGSCFHEGPQRSEPLFLLVQMYQLMSPVKLRWSVFFAQVIGIVKSEREKRLFPAAHFHLNKRCRIWRIFQQSRLPENWKQILSDTKTLNSTLPNTSWNQSDLQGQCLRQYGLMAPGIQSSRANQITSSALPCF